jgi:uncharacterized protein YciI
MNRLFRLAALALLAAALAFEARVAAQTQTAAPPQKNTYIVIYHRGPSWIPEKPFSEQNLKEHGQYILNQYKQGTVKSGGPFLDNTGGACAIEVDSADDAKKFVAADPAIVSEVFTAEIHPWRLVQWDKVASH